MRGMGRLEVRIFTYSFVDKGFYLGETYIIAAFFTWVIASQSLELNGWEFYLIMGLIEAIVLAVVAFFDHKKDCTLPTTIKVDNSTVILSRLWEYQRFDLSTVIKVTEPAELSPLQEFLYLRQRTTAVYVSNGRNHGIHIGQEINGYRELLDLLSADAARYTE